ncbi:probable tubulin polyglutamylase TTLL2 isoform X4 [Neocloeon triangulifer]|uniref:probable tubulin polyglutamylase TTLL2 isoform X4 n=1 Tax=Neocloeon triangulifer TaxID=2078957 RepID=UPI00286F328F|nr:probable tubulin polyglutamylase TTLL2 isoform X4 [Neocloeon triangulifer]
MDWEDGPFVFRINDNGIGPNLLLQVCLERGWREHSECGVIKDNWNLWWRTTGFPMSHYKQLKPWQYTNHIPKGSSICRKDHLARYLRCMKKVYGSIFDFSPPCYQLPLEYTKLLAECSGSNRSNGRVRSGSFHCLEPPEEDVVWICKPVGQSQGRGIFLFREFSDLNYASSAVVQKYVTNPLLIGGYKFDLRLYACIPSFRPLCVYLYREGLVRFATDKFSLGDLNNLFRHLTNSSLNRLGPGYTRQKERVGAGCKWSLKQLRHYLNQNGENDWLLWQRIASIVALTVLAQNASSPPPPSPNCFEFYGFDILVDTSLRPWLLEVNLSPALGADSDVDAAVKKPMLHDMFDLLGMPVSHTGLSMFTSWQPPQEDSTSDSEDYTTARPRLQRARSLSILTGEDETEGLPSSRWSREDAGPVKVVPSSRWSRQPQPMPPSFQNSTVWGNGRDWRDAPAKDGDWVRVFPIGFSSNVKKKVSYVDHAAEIKAAVADVHRFTKAAKEAAKLVELEAETGKNRACFNDRVFNEAFRGIMGPEYTGEIWLPPK